MSDLSKWISKTILTAGAILLSASGAEASVVACMGATGGFAEIIGQTNEITSAISGLSPAERQARNAMKNSIGQCSLRLRLPENTVAEIATSLRRLDDDNTNLFEGAVRPMSLLQYQRNSAAMSMARIRANGAAPRSINQEEFVAIDALARTLYREMGSERCNEQAGYMEAVARIVINRAMHENGPRYRRGPHLPTSQRITQAIVADRQFSLWNNMDEMPTRQHNGHVANFYRAACPKPPENELENRSWNRAVDVAMHAFLDRDAFLRETHQFSTVMYYTSGVPMRGAFTELNGLRYPNTPRGTPLNRASCIRFWREN